MKGVQNAKGSVRHTDVPNCAFSHQAGNYEDDTRTEDDETDLHRQVDPEDFVFAEREVLSTRRVATPAPGSLTANAY